MTSPLITVLMPARNAGAYIAETVRSLRAQTMADFELLVVDDDSSDDTVPQTRAAAAGDERLRLVTGQGRLGFSGALNLGLSLARGALIARMDADDIAVPRRLEIQAGYLKDHPETGLCGGLVQTFGLRAGRFHRLPLSHEQTLCYALFDNPFAHPTVMVRRALLEQHGLRYDPAFCPSDDYELWARAVRLFPCVNLDAVLVHYRVHAQSLTQAEWGDMDARAARVSARELQALGLPADDAAAQFHRQLGRGRCVRLADIGQLTRAEQWLTGVLEANTRCQRYPPQVLQETVSGIWYRVCYHARHLGFPMLNRYRHSALRRPAGRRWDELALLKAAMVKDAAS